MKLSPKFLHLKQAVDFLLISAAMPNLKNFQVRELILLHVDRIFSALKFGLLSCMTAALMISGIAVAGPVASGSEGARTIPKIDLPVGCQMTGQPKYVPGKCEGGSCLVVDANCCGNGTIEASIVDSNSDYVIYSGEACDGTAGGITNCRSDCTVCGDAQVQLFHQEQCDLGFSKNGTLNSRCTSDCIATTCGNNRLEAIENSEECDGEQFRSSDIHRRNLTCDQDCNIHFCGDSSTDTGEECDDGNTNNLDACLDNCVAARCGDGFRRTDTEECDDGNTIESDECSSTCRISRCGDGIRNRAEVCDGSDFDFAAGVQPSPILATCSATCQLVQPTYCGDGIRNGSEDCDTSDFELAVGVQPGAGDVFCDGCRIARGAASCPLHQTRVCAEDPFAAYGLYDQNNYGYQNAFIGFGFYGSAPASSGSSAIICSCQRYGGGCFDPETLIELSDHSIVLAKEIKAGDQIYFPESQSSAVVEQVIEGSEEEPLVVLSYRVNQELIISKLSKKHVVKTTSGLKRAQNLNLSDRLIQKNGEALKIENISEEKGAKVINFVLNSNSAKLQDHLIISDQIITGDLWLQNNLEE